MMRTAMGVASDGLEQAKLNFYEEYRLAHVFASVGAISQSDAERLRFLPGISAADARTKTEMRAELYGSNDIITLRVISFNPADEQRLNNFQMTGSKPAAANEIALNFMFMDAHGLSPGDEISLTHQGRTFTLAATGSFLSPEYVYIAPGFTDILPDNAGFGIAYITAEAMGNITGRHGIFNNVVFALEEGFIFEDVELLLRDALAPNGLISLTERADQISYTFVDMQTTSMQSISMTLPLVFMVMAAVVLYLMMTRIIEQERMQIGTLKALGFSNFTVISHYLCYGLVVGLLGGILGFAMGAAMSGVYLTMFLEFFLLPELVQPISPMYAVFSLTVAIGTGVLGALAGALKVIGLIPAEAMRPPTPPPVKFDIVGKIKPLGAILTSRGQMSLRGILRSPIRSGFIVLGVTFSFGLLSVFGSMESLIDAMIYAQFTEQRLYNVRVTLTHPIPYGRAINAAHGVRHITQAEGLFEVPVSLTLRHLQTGTVITGVPENSELYRIFDTTRGVAYPPPTAGLIITNGLADALGAVAGDMVYLQAPSLSAGIYIPVAAVIEQSLGSGAYLQLGALSALLGEQPVANAIIFNTNNLPYVLEYFRKSRYTASIEDIDTTLRKYTEMMEPYMGIFMVLNIMGAAVAFAIIYNTATISLSERKREYATLRVLGLSTGEVCEIMRFEYWVLGVLGMAIGVPFSSGLMIAVNSMLDTSMFSMPTMLPPIAYITAIVGCCAAITLSNFSAKRKIAKFDMVEVLKGF